MPDIYFLIEDLLVCAHFMADFQLQIASFSEDLWL